MQMEFIIIEYNTNIYRAPNTLQNKIKHMIHEYGRCDDDASQTCLDPLHSFREFRHSLTNACVRIILNCLC